MFSISYVQGDTKFLKNIACFVAGKQIHKIGGLRDNLVPSVVVEVADVEESGNLMPSVFFILFIICLSFFQITWI